MNEQRIYKIRSARRDEVALLGEIEERANALFAGIGMPEIAEGEAMPPSFVRSFFHGGMVHVAVDAQDVPVGFALAHFIDGNAHLYEISVDPAYGKQGIGAKLLGSVFDWARRAGMAAVTLSTFGDVPWNAPFYERHGFVRLPANDWTPGLYVLRLREEDGGLPVNRRCFMRKEL